MTSGQDVSEFLDTFYVWCSDASEDQAICLFEGLLTNPDMSLSQRLDVAGNRSRKT
jgi:hypothetical protein